MSVTWNPLDKGSGVTLSNGNLTAQTLTGYTNGNVRATKGVSSGKWYWEVKFNSGYVPCIGISNATASLTTWDGGTNCRMYYSDGYKVPGFDRYGPTAYVINDIIGVFLDMDAGTIGFSRNGTNYGVAFTDVKTALGTTIYPYQSNGGSDRCVVTANFGATPFAYPIPDGYTALDSGTPTAIDITVAAIKATSTNQAINPTILATRDISIASVIVTATSQAITPIVSVSSNIDVNINSVIATATTQAINPVITAQIILNTSIVAVKANCTVQSKVPFITAIINEIAQINISESIRKPLIQANTRNHMINQLTRRIRTEVI